ncbi:MAG: tRNA dihydrouridine synthase DusB [Bacteroidetes bacterium 4572_77]|nr:MAG: tRNA dihydrouridine synthase DusB [Bacteroidetes bacterium 4572_77]
MILYLAPLQGYTESYFRNAYSEYFDCFHSAIAPFIPSGHGDTIKKSRIRDLLPENNHKMPVDPQVIGKYAPEFIPLAKHLYEYGYKTLNINMGCPVSSIAQKMRGSGILPYPEMVEMLLEKLILETPNEISLKMRLGFFKKQEIKDLLPIINRFPIKELIIHPRLGSQMYTGTPDLDAFEWCLKNTKIPIIYSGDIYNKESLTKLQKRFPKQDKWMIGRGVIYDLFLPTTLKQGTLTDAEKVDLFGKFHQSLFQGVIAYRNRPKNQLNKMKEYWGYFSRQFENHQAVHYNITHCNSLEEFEEKSRQILQDEVWRKVPLFDRIMSE